MRRRRKSDDWPGRETSAYTSSSSPAETAAEATTEAPESASSQACRTGIYGARKDSGVSDRQQATPLRSSWPRVQANLRLP